MEVELDPDKELQDTVIVEPQQSLDVHLEPSLLSSHDCVGLTNTTGFTQQLPAGTEPSTAMGAMPILTPTDQVEEIIPVFGVPEALLSDRGTNLLSYLMRGVCKLLGIEHYCLPPAVQRHGGEIKYNT